MLENTGTPEPRPSRRAVERAEGAQSRKLSEAISEALSKSLNVEYAASYLEAMAREDDALLREIVLPTLRATCLQLVRGHGFRRNFMARQNAKRTLAVPAKAEVLKEEHTARVKRASKARIDEWLDYTIGKKHKLGDMSGAQILPFAEEAEKRARTETVVAKWLRSVAARTRDMIVRDVLTNEELGDLYRQAELDCS